jgi:hypothetical protein
LKEAIAMHITDEIREYLFNHNIAIRSAYITEHGFVYIETNAKHPIFRYSTKSPGMLQHKLGFNRWHDIQLDIRREQMALF